MMPCDLACTISQGVAVIGERRLGYAKQGRDEAVKRFSLVVSDVFDRRIVCDRRWHATDRVIAPEQKSPS